MWSVYILLCAGDSLYTGISPNPQKRFMVHKKGQGGAYTRSHKPLKIVYLEQLADRSSALKREAQVKSWSREKKMRLLSPAKTKSSRPKSG